MNNRYLTLLRNRKHYRYLWLAAVVSYLGDWFNTIASVIIVNRYTDAGLAVGALFLARALPPFVLGPFVGVIADRFNRKWILVFADLVRVPIVLAFLFVDRPERIWLIYVLTVAQFVVSSLFQPAKSALLPTLVETDEELLLANTLSGATWSAMLALGAAIGGFTAALFGAEVALVIDAFTFLLSAGFILLIPSQKPVSAETGQSNGMSEFIEGVRYVVGRPAVGIVTLVKALAQIGSADILIAIYAERYFPVGEEGATALGLMFMAAGLGAVAGPLIGNQFSDNSARSLQNWIGVGFGFVVVGWIIFGTAPTLFVAMIGLFVRFIGGSIGWTYSTVLLQLRVPNHLLGRVTSIDFAAFTLAMALSVWLTGYILDATPVTPRQIAMMFGVGTVAAILIWVAGIPAMNRDTVVKPISAD